MQLKPERKDQLLLKQKQNKIKTHKSKMNANKDFLMNNFIEHTQKNIQKKAWR